MSSIQENRDIYNIVNRALPNISTYIKVVLKREKLSDEAESMRARYEGFLNILEQVPGSQRPISIVQDDDGGYFSGRPRVSELIEQPKGLPGISHAGYLLRRDDKFRWHRSWVKVESKEMKLFIFEDINEEILIRSFSLDGVSTRFGPNSVPDCDKENTFAVCGIGIAIEPLPVAPEPSDPSNGLVSPAPPTSTGPLDEGYFAAYSDNDYRQWKEVLHMLTTGRSSSRISMSFLDNAPWLSTGAQDNHSTSSSSFGSNRESVISTTSSLLNNRLSAEAKPESSLVDEARKISATKQQQPLPQPPSMMPENVPLPEDDDDNASDGTIYESIDNLVSQFDDAMRATAAAMGQIGENMKSGGKKRKKKGILPRQTSFLSRAKSHKSNFLADKKTELEIGDRYSGYLFKKTSSGSWRKRWCTLKGCVFGYYKASDEANGREYVVLDSVVRKIDDPKRSFAFSLSCKGVDEMFLAAEDDTLCGAWMARLTNCSRNHGEYSEAWSNWKSEDSLSTLGGSQLKLNEGIYNVPRSLPLDQLLVPRGPTTAMTPEAAIDEGIYSVPKFLLEGHSDGQSTQNNGSDIYDVPRMSISPDEEGIYDDPYDIMDMEIYDYPPDANDLDQFLQDSGLGTTEHSTRTSTITVTSDRTSSTMSEDSWRTMSLPPLPQGVRPYSIISSADEYQSNRNSVISVESSVHTFPRNHPAPDLQPLQEADPTPDYPDTSSLEYGHCIMRGHLHKRERFMTWTKLYCIIRNNFLEAHKSHGGGYMPVLKLFLPGSEVKPGGGDNKRKFAFQVKHPRRDGTLVFATETPEEYPQWVKAFQSGASIEVQAVSNVEEMRITDLEMQRRWTSAEKEPTIEEGWNGTLPRRKTFSNDSKGTEEYSTDTLKRRRRFTLSKLTKKKQKDDKKLAGYKSTPELKHPPVTPPITPVIDDLRHRSVSCEELPAAADTGLIESHTITSPDGSLKFQGFLSVARTGANTHFIRYWCVFDGATVYCYNSQHDLTLTMNVSLSGSQICEAFNEAARPHSFKVWHMETGQCIYFSADNQREFHKWFTVITQNADQIPTPQQAGSPSKTVFFVVPGTELKVRSFHVRQRSNSLPSSPLDEAQGDTGSIASTGQGSNDTPVNTFYRGNLMKASNTHSGKWKDRFCVVKDGQLSLYHNQGDKNAIISIDLAGCSIELVTVPRSSSHKLVFKLNGQEKTHTFAAPTESEMYAWISALRDGSYEASTRSQHSTGGSANSSPSLSGKSSLRKRGSKSKLPEADLISYVPANTLTAPDMTGFADMQVSPDSWSRFWCVVHSDCLYIYQTQQSQATVKTVVLPGYEIRVADPLTVKRQWAIVLAHNGVAPVCLAVADEVELNMWLSALDKGSRAEGSGGQQPKQSLLDDKPLPGKLPSRNGSYKKKGPMKADHSITAVKDSGSVDSIPSAISKTPEAHQDSIIKRYEKRIRKTHRVANQTEQKLKEHQTALLHFKKELSKHTAKLQELADSGESNAQKRLVNIRKKVQQVDKIVPYLGRYVAVNRQAEMQTIAVLKESCTMEVQKMGKSPPKQPVNTSTPKERRRSREHTDSIVEENPYASLSEIKPQVEAVKAKSNYAQLDFSRVPSPGGSLRPPSVNYAQVQIMTNGRGPIIDGSLSPSADEPVENACDEPSQDTTLTPENAAAINTPSPLETVQEQSAPVSPEPLSILTDDQPKPVDPQLDLANVIDLLSSGNFEEKSNVRILTSPTPEPQEPVEIAPAAPEILPPPVGFTEQPLPMEGISLPEGIPPPEVLPPPTTQESPVEIKKPPLVPKRSSSLEPQAPGSSESSPTHKVPPKVARKPTRQAADVNGDDRTSPARQDVSAVISSVPSVMERIKALRQQNS